MDKHLLSYYEDNKIITLGRGMIISKDDIDNCPGIYPVYSSSASENGEFGKYGKYMFDDERITWSIDGGGRLFYRPQSRYSVTNVCGWIKINNSLKFDTKYVYYSLLYQWMNLHFDYTYKAHPSVIRKQYFLKENELPKQKEIVKLLDELNDSINKDQKELEKLDELVKSRFIEMFGNLQNTVRLGDCCEVHARIGWQALTQKEHMQTGEYMLITGTDFKNNEIDYSTCVYVSKERYEMDKHIILNNDDVLITKDGTIGKVAIVHNLQKPATLNGGVFVVRPDDRFNKEYVSYVFKGPLFEEHIEKSKTGATIKHLNQRFLVEFKIPVPTKAEQEEFGKFVEQIDKSKFIIQKRIDLYKELLDKKMSEYFE